VLDQITKAMVRPALALHESREVIPGFLDLTRVHNTGAAFGMLNNAEFPFKTVVLSLVAAVALGGVAWYAATVPLSDRLARIGIAGVLGGATVVLYGLVGILGVRIWLTNDVDFSKPLNQMTAAIPLIIGIADFTWQAGDLTFTGIALGSIAALLVYHGMRLLSRETARTSPS